MRLTNQVNHICFILSTISVNVYNENPTIVILLKYQKCKIVLMHFGSLIVGVLK